MDNSEDRLFVCEICRSDFTTKQYLQRHYTSHTSERNFICVICQNPYKYHQAKLNPVPTVKSSPSSPKRKISKKLFAEEKKEEKLKMLDMSKIIITSPFPPSNGNSK